MDLPGLHHKTFHSHAKAMYSKLEMLEDRVFGQTVACVREVHAKHSGITAAEDVLNISVSFDGTWLTHGHSSHIGVGYVVDLLTGLCIDALDKIGHSSPMHDWSCHMLRMTFV